MFEKVVTSKLIDEIVRERAEILERHYEELLKHLGNEDRRMPYNLIITRKWMFVVLRRKERIKDSIKINALSFLGSFMVNSKEDLKLFPAKTPLDALLDVTYPCLLYTSPSPRD
eukprot:TRINITY_DN1990_c0_g1_i10.p1 TRINITY_DN1990_c0_g1~~TRINITY_DN1990_c0_g1_i10.p1  ORF type:complete len:114 (-),score=27.42 TRINITY_DN1990_c0_g1_i10:53-394(-)